MQKEAEAASPAADEFEPLDTFTDEDQAKITKIQAAARGKADRKRLKEQVSSTRRVVVLSCTVLLYKDDAWMRIDSVALA